MSNFSRPLPGLYGPLHALEPAFHAGLRWLAEIESSGLVGSLNAKYAGFERGTQFDAVFQPGADARVQEWPLVGTPVLPIGVVVGYLTGLVVLSLAVKSLGFPKLKLTPLVFVYNMVCAFLSAYMVYESVLSFHHLYGLESLLSNRDRWCHPIDQGPSGQRQAWSNPWALRLASIIYVHFLAKVLELSDTFIMVLKQNWNQVSFLHVYHHASVIFPTWFFNTTYLPGGEAWWCCFLNSLVHTFMYSHYGLRSIGISLPVKPLLTGFQIVQFLTYIYQAVDILFLSDPARGCAAPSVPAWQLLVQASIFLWLFADFYVQAYLKPAKAKKD